MLKKENKNSSEYIGVILEDINSKFDVIKEGHSVLSEQIKKLDKKVDRNHQEFVEFGEEINGKVDSIETETKSNFQTVFDLLSNIDDDIKDIKSEIVEIRKILTNKADLDRVDALEKRVKIAEAELLELLTT